VLVLPFDQHSPDAVSAFDAALSKPIAFAAVADMVTRMAECSTPQPVLAEAKPVGGSGYQVLVVDDNPINLTIASVMLERAGYRVERATDGVEAVRAAAHTRYDAILMDIQMPEMDGIAATRVIRQGPGPSRHTPIIAITANAMVGMSDEYLA
jgi:CheY-like chemotaxis protein